MYSTSCRTIKGYSSKEECECYVFESQLSNNVVSVTLTTIKSESMYRLREHCAKGCHTLKIKLSATQGHVHVVLRVILNHSFY